jgi:TRAP-type C4-dicarboxylate transport system substrate-binding protein
MCNRLLARVLAVFLLPLLIAACGTGAEPTPDAAAGAGTGAGEQTEGEETADWPEMTIRVATIYQENLNEAQAVARFAENVEERTGGAITFETHFGTALGSQDEMNELLVTGGLDMAVHGLAPSDEYVGLFLPYTIDGYDHLQRVVDSEVGDAWSQSAEENAGVVANQVWARGVRHANLREPAESYEDLEGRRIRVADIEGLIAAVESWNAVPVVMPFDELFTSLASGALDGAENTMGQMISERHYEVTDHVLKTAHSVSAVFWLSNASWWNGLDQDVADMLDEEISAAVDEAIEENKASEEEWQAELEGFGMTVVEPPSMEPFLEGAERVGVDGLAERIWGADAWDTIQELREG